MLPVYCEHFGLTREPFNITPDPSFLYLSESHREALAQLVYGIKSRRGFVVLNGAVVSDEAQNLPTEVLENVRLLSDFETTRDKLLQILLVGHPGLGSRLNA